MNTIQTLTLKDRETVSSYLTQFPPQISEHTFTNLYVWGHSRTIHFTEVDGSLLFLLKSTGSTEKYVLFGPPAGTISLEQAVSLLGDRYAGAIRIPSGTFGTETSGLQLREDRDHADYVYRRKDLADLEGRHYAKKRNRIKQCLKSCQCSYEPLTLALLAECSAMQKRWCLQRKCDHDPGLCSEFIAIKETMLHFEELKVFGGAIRVNGAIEAYAIAESLSPDTAVWHFEKATPDIPGLGQLINQWFAKYGLQDFEFVNREQDLGIMGLRQAKESYYPHHLVEKFTTDPTAMELPHFPREICV